MLRRNEKRKYARKLNLKKEREPHYGYSEMSVRRNNEEYGTNLGKRPLGRYYSDYTDNDVDYLYNDWQDRFNTDYMRDYYNLYYSMYDTDHDDTYRYRSRRKYDDDYYEDTEYSFNYDDYDTDYSGKESHSDWLMHNQYGERRQKDIDASKYLYGYDESHPGHRHDYSHRQSYHKKSKRYSPNNTDLYSKNKFVYDLDNVLDQKRFKHTKYNGPQNTSGIFSESELESSYKRQARKKKKPSYRVYSTQVTNNTKAFDRKLKSPERSMSEIPVMAFNSKKKRGGALNNGSDLIYLPLVMNKKEKRSGRKITCRNHLKYQTSTETAEKPLEENVQLFRAVDSEENRVQYKINKRSKQNPAIFKANQNITNVYSMSGGLSKVFRKSATKRPSTVRNIENTENRTSDTKIERIPDTRSSEIINTKPNTRESVARNNSATRKSNYTTNDAFNTDMEIGHVRKSGLGQSYVLPKNHNVENEQKSWATGDQRFDRGLQSNVKSAPLKGIIKTSIAPENKNIGLTKKSPSVDKPGSNYSSQYFGPKESDGHDHQKIPSRPSVVSQRSSVASLMNVTRQSNVSPRSQTPVERKSSIVTKQTTPKSLLQQFPKNNLSRQSSTFQKGQGFVARDQVTGDEEQNIRNSGRRSQSAVGRSKMIKKEPQDIKRVLSRSSAIPALNKSQSSESTGQHQSMLRHSNKPHSGRSLVDREHLTGAQRHSLSRQSNVGMARESSAQQRNQSFANEDHTIKSQMQGTRNISEGHGNKQNVSKYMTRESNVPERGQSNVKESIGGKTSSDQRGQKMNSEDRRKSSIFERQRPDNRQVTKQASPVNISGASAVSKKDRQSSVVERQSRQRNITHPLPLHESNPPTKSKSKILKRAFNKLGAATNLRHGFRYRPTEKSNESTATSPVVDIIMSSGDVLGSHQSLLSQSETPVAEPNSKASSRSNKQQRPLNQKKSTRSKLSKPFKSLFSKTKKSGSKTRQSSNVGAPTEVSDQTYPSDQTYLSDFSSGDIREKETVSSDQSVNDAIYKVLPIIQEYDLASFICFLQIAQFIIGVTIYDKLMGVLAVL